MTEPIQYRKAIKVKFLGPTTYRGSRLSVRWADEARPRREVPYNHALSSAANALAAAQKFERWYRETNFPNPDRSQPVDWAVSPDRDGWVVTFVYQTERSES